MTNELLTENALLKEKLKGHEWIPCSERLPEYGIQVLTTDKDGDFELNHIIDEDDGEWFWNGAIAWMPLPEPYRGTNE